MSSWSRLLEFSFCFFILFAFSVTVVYSVGNNDAALAIFETEESLASAYDAILRAEEAGANVSVLVERLDIGAKYLAEAYVWARLGVYDEAKRFTGLCAEVVDDVENEAIVLMDTARKMEAADLFVRVFGSAVGVVIVVFGSFFIWDLFRSRYIKRAWGMKPEVDDAES